jgi:Ca2+-binding EF-hand superfamily protein
MATFSNIAEVAQRAHENQECPLCFESLICKPVANLLDTDNHLICHHLCHLECLQAELSTHCPSCSRNYSSTKVVPSLHPDPQVWFEHMDTDKDGFLSHEEMTEGLKGQLDLDWSAIEVDVDTLWLRWDKNRDGKISFAEFCDANDGVIVYLQRKYPRNPRAPPPDLLKAKRAWFRYWDEDDSKTLDKSEIVRALIKTFAIYDIKKNVVVEIVEKVWPIFDTDNSGVIEYEEFIETDNLGDSIAAEILNEQGLLLDYYDQEFAEEGEENEQEEEGEGEGGKAIIEVDQEHDDLDDDIEDAEEGDEEEE